MSATPVSSPSSDTSTRTTRISSSRRLRGAQTLWLVALVANTLFFGIGLPQYMNQLNQFVQTGTSLAEANATNLAEVSMARSIQIVQLFRQTGFSTQVGLVYILALGVIPIVVYTLIAALLFWRRSDDWMVLLVSLTLLLTGSVNRNLTSLIDLPRLYPQAAFQLSFVLAVGLIGVTMLAFPDGRFVPRWSPILALMFTVVFAVWNTRWGAGLAILIGVSVTGSMTAILVYRYRRFFSLSQRQQTKWAVIGFVSLLVSVAIRAVPTVLTRFGNHAPSSVIILLVVTASDVAIVLFPLCFAFAMLRYRLYDVDLTINRSLVFGLVAVGLGALFVAVFWVAQAVIVALLGVQQAGIAIGVAGALIALCYNPVRRRAQHFVDRRLYGLRFDLNELQHAQHLPEVKNPGLLSGHKLGEYDVLDVIGKGGMGEVYKAARGQQIVAIKTLPEMFALNDANRKRFEREAATLATLDHPNIVKMYATGESSGLYYLVMEFVSGHHLGQILRDWGKMPLEDARALMVDCAAALDYAHARGLVHRDIKPSNIMLRAMPDGETQQAVLMDFGVAKIQDARTNLTGTGAVGTIDYMAPEQIMTSTAVDRRADVYALGVMLYEMLTGERPFKGSSAQVLFAHLQQPAPDPCKVNAEIPAHVALAVRKAMEKQPEDRFATAGELAAALSSGP